MKPEAVGVASPSGSTADVADLAFARACPWLEQGAGTAARGPRKIRRLFSHFDGHFPVIIRQLIVQLTGDAVQLDRNFL
jgi:hypothetical protein